MRVSHFGTRCRDVVVGRRLSAWRGHSAAVKSLAFSPDDRTLTSDIASKIGGLAPAESGIYATASHSHSTHNHHEASLNHRPAVHSAKKRSIRNHDIP